MSENLAHFLLVLAAIVIAIVGIVILYDFSKKEEAKHPPKIVEYTVTSVRVDDDGEYHLIVRGPSGLVHTYHDLAYYDLTVFVVTEANPIMKISYRWNGGEYHEPPVNYRTHKLYLPKTYKIETFND
jgi:hypothetical protein